MTKCDFPLCDLPSEIEAGTDLGDFNSCLWHLGWMHEHADQIPRRRLE